VFFSSHYCWEPTTGLTKLHIQHIGNALSQEVKLFTSSIKPKSRIHGAIPPIMYTRICGVALTRKDNFAINPGKMILKLQTNVKTSDANVLRKPPEDNLISPKYFGIILIKIFRYFIL
jgi:hypothetical protein